MAVECFLFAEKREVDRWGAVRSVHRGVPWGADPAARSSDGAIMGAFIFLPHPQ